MSAFLNISGPILKASDVVRPVLQYYNVCCGLPRLLCNFWNLNFRVFSYTVKYFRHFRMSEIISNMIFWAINFPLLSHFRTALGNMNTKVDLVYRITVLEKMRITTVMLSVSDYILTWE
jgi:hypothetical protein